MTADDHPRTLDLEGILSCLPHRQPFLLVDRVLDYSLDGELWLKALKNVTFNEPFFAGHFPDHPIMPGVLVLEAMAQAAGVMVQLWHRRRNEHCPMFYLVKIDKARFTGMIHPGDQLIMEIHQRRTLRNMGVYEGTTSIDGKVVARAEFLCAEKRD